MSETLLANAFVGYPEELAIFEKPIQNVGVRRSHCTTFYPVNDFSSQGVIQFAIANNSNCYVDLRKTQLNITCKIVACNGDIVETPKVATAQPAAAAAATDGTSGGDDAEASKKSDDAGKAKIGIVGVVNNFMHSMFSRVDVALQNKVLTHSDQSYPYLAYLKTLLYSSKEEKESALQTQMYFKDTAGAVHDSNWFMGDNAGLKTRSKFFANSREVDMCGHLYSDVLEISRFIPYGVPLNITLYPSTPEFCLLSPDSDSSSGQYKVVITKASLNVCMVEVAPVILTSHANTLKTRPAIFPYSKTEVKKFTIARGVFSAEVNDAFNGRVPAELIWGLVSDSSNHGQLKENPFNFEHYGLNFIQVSVDGQDMGQGPIQPRYGEDPEDSIYMDAYKTLCGLDGDDWCAPVTRHDFPQGYCFYRIYSEALQSGNDDIIPLKRSGNMRISLKFENQLTQAATLKIFAKFPAALKIDKNRAVHEV